MKNIKILSDKYIQLNDRTRFNHFFDCKPISSENGWDNLPINSLYSNVDSSHYYIKLNNQKEIPMDKSATCLVFKVENGYFQDCYALIEINRTLWETVIYILNDDKVLRYSAIKGVLSIKEVNDLLTNESIAKTTAEILREFNVSYTRQKCQTFCENLPTQCLLNREFIRDVVKAISSTPMNIIGIANPEFIKINSCLDSNLKIFKDSIVLARTENSELNKVQ